jgi:hypothetical protein
VSDTMTVPVTAGGLVRAELMATIGTPFVAST